MRIKRRGRDCLERILPGKQRPMEKELEADPFFVHAGDDNLFHSRRDLSFS
jgi:hypothetical protein